MTLTKNNLRQLIFEVIAAADPVRLKGSTMSSGAFATGGKSQRASAETEVDSQERSIIHQVDQFLLNLAALPEVDLQKHRPALQTALKALQTKIGAARQTVATEPEEQAQEPTAEPQQGAQE
jgi:hypothetical protein